MAQERAGSTRPQRLSMTGESSLPAWNRFWRNRWRWRRRLPRILTLALALSVTAPVVSAHSLKELETALGDREKYFQPVDKNAPDFTLQDADGRVLGLANFRG